MTQREISHTSLEEVLSAYEKALTEKLERLMIGDLGPELDKETDRLEKEAITLGATGLNLARIELKTSLCPEALMALFEKDTSANPDLTLTLNDLAQLKEEFDL